jgi:hypothetical protein
MNEFQNMISLPSKPLTPEEEVSLCGWGLTSYPNEVYPNQIQNLTVKVKNCNDYQYAFEYNILHDQVCTLQEESGACIVS